MINDAEVFDISAITDQLTELKNCIFEERKLMVKKLKNITSLVSEDYRQSICVCKFCDKMLFKICNLKGISAN